MNFLHTQLEQIIAFRKDLHQTPELSGKKHKTTAKIKEFISLSQPGEIVTFRGMTRLAALFNGTETGRTIL
jgi:metal-dependent amidase/aminoacylase/carboxypeptidase family protein